MSALLGWLRRSFVEPELPTLAVELRTRSVGVVRTARQGGKPALVAAAVLDLPPGVLRLSMSENNVVDQEALGRVMTAALERVGVMSGGRAALVVPDPVARVSLLNAPDMRGKSGKDAQELLRFKLQKSVPFDIRQAHIRSVPAGYGPQDELLTATMLPAVIGGFEELCRSVGLVPGLVELCGLALLRASMPVAPIADRLLVNWDESYVTLLLSRGQWPLFVRTLGPEVAGEMDAVMREVRNTVLYYRDHLNGTTLAGTAVRSAHLPIETVMPALEDVLGHVPEALDPSWRLAGVQAGGLSPALAGAAAALVGSAS